MASYGKRLTIFFWEVWFCCCREETYLGIFEQKGDVTVVLDCVLFLAVLGLALALAK